MYNLEKMVWARVPIDALVNMQTEELAKHLIPGLVHIYRGLIFCSLIRGKAKAKKWPFTKFTLSLDVFQGIERQKVAFSFYWN